MAIEKEIEKALDNNRAFVDSDPRKLNDFLKDLKNSGLLVKKEYDLPPLDTVGKQLYREKSQFSC